MAVTPPMKPTSQGDDDRHQAGRDQFLERADCRDVNALVVIRLDACLAFAQAGDFLELAVDFGDHALGIAVDAHDQHGREHGRDGDTDQQAEEDQRIHDVKDLAAFRQKFPDRQPAGR